MMPAVGRRELADEHHLERQIERQMGCMAGFLQLFDRHQILSGRRVYSSRRLPSSPVAGSTSPSERSEVSTASYLKEAALRSPSPEPCPSSPESHAKPAAEAPARPYVPLPLPIFEFKDGLRSSWKLREAPRLSLDSRAVVDAKGKLRPREIRTAPQPTASGNQSDALEADESERQRRSPSVVARLMGLDALPDSGGGNGCERPAELRRSASESRVPRDPSYYRFIDASSFQRVPAPAPEAGDLSEDFFRFLSPYPAESRSRDTKLDPASRTHHPRPIQRKSFFDAQDFFPDAPPKRSGSLYGEIERRLRMRGIDEPAKDLETLKQILEALQLKGLLHSKPSDPEINGRRRSNLVSPTESPIVVMKPAPRHPPQPSRSASGRRNPAEIADPARSRRDRNVIRTRSLRSPDRNESTRSPSPSFGSPARRRVSNSAETLRTKATPTPQRRTSALQPPKANPGRVGPDPFTAPPQRNRRTTAEERIWSPADDDTATTVSESSICSSSQLDFERYKAGRSLLERCDKLLNSIAAITAGGEQAAAVDQQPSPVSVLDASFLGEETSSPLPITKRSIDFKDQAVDWEDDQWSAATPTIRSGCSDGPDSEEDREYHYVSEILRASDRIRDLSDVYAILERRHQPSEPSARARLCRRLLFDAVAEILDRKRHVYPWDSFARAKLLSHLPPLDGAGDGLLREVWSEVRRNREPAPPVEDLNDVTCAAIRKDLVGGGDGGWGAHPPAEMSDTVLQIERQIFKDIVAETIRDLSDVASFTAAPVPPVPRRKLVF